MQLWAMPITLRASQALRLWQQVALSEVESGLHDLSMRQAAILLTVYLDAPPHTVRGLAAKVPTYVTIKDVMGLLGRHRDDSDRRNVLVRRTVEGALYVERFGDVIIARAKGLPL